MFDFLLFEFLTSFSPNLYSLGRNPIGAIAQLTSSNHCSIFTPFLNPFFFKSFQFRVIKRLLTMKHLCQLMSLSLFHSFQMALKETETLTTKLLCTAICLTSSCLYPSYKLLYPVVPAETIQHSFLTSQQKLLDSSIYLTSNGQECHSILLTLCHDRILSGILQLHLD